MDWIERLTDVVGDGERITTNDTVREQHGKDMTYHDTQLPDVVVFPKTTKEIQAILEFANDNQIPVVPYGVGSSLEGHIIPVNGGMSLDLSLMDEIVSVEPENFTAKVQPGVTREQLNKELKKYGLFFPVDPGANATIGGMTATNASGTNSVKYGGMKHAVLGLEVVLADGRVIRTGGGSVKTSAGYNLTGLFVGSEGTLGIFSEITVRLMGIPEVIVAAKALFQSVESAGNAAANLLKAGVQIGKVELVDEKTIKAVNDYNDTDYEEVPTLFIELSGSQASVNQDIGMVKEMLATDGCTAFQFEADSIAKAKLWEARHHVAFAILAANPGKEMLATDVSVPISELPGAIIETRRLVDQYGIDAAIFGHVGDGNYHAAIALDPSDPEELDRVKKVNQHIVEYALSKGGTCTGEHGIGIGKKSYLKQEHGEAVDVMVAIKKTLDPNNILNPGKIF